MEPLPQRDFNNFSKQVSLCLGDVPATIVLDNTPCDRESRNAAIHSLHRSLGRTLLKPFGLALGSNYYLVFDYSDYILVRDCDILYMYKIANFRFHALKKTSSFLEKW